MIGRVEEWMKPTCQKHNCRYYSHHDYPNCSYCVSPDDLCHVLYPKEEKEPEANDRPCEKCKHKVETKPGVEACDVWDCCFEPKDEQS